MAKQKKIGIVVRPTRTEARTKAAKRPQPPVAIISEMTNSEIKRRTGFDDINMLLALLAIVCNGHFNMITKHVSALTWFEEWLLYFEFVWGRSLTRLCDATSTYKISRRDVTCILKQKLNIIVKARESWPA